MSAPEGVSSTAEILTSELGAGRQPAPRRAAVRSLFRDPAAVAGMVVVLLLSAGAVFAPVLAPDDPNKVDVVRRFTPPSTHSPLGTDHLGRDMLSRLLYGGRISIGICVVAGLLVGLIGTAVGLLCGYRGGLLDAGVGRVIDLLLAFPPFLLAMAVLGLLGPGLRNLVLVLVAIEWASYARVVRGSVLGEREKEYVDAARASGASPRRIMVCHVLPNVVAPVVVLVTLEMGMLLLEVSGLSFLGLGVSPPTAEWGSMLSEGRVYLSQAPQMMLFPGLAIFLLVLGFNLAGDGLRDTLDPQTRRLVGRRSRRIRGASRRPQVVVPAPEGQPPLPVASAPLLSIRNLTVSFETAEGPVTAVDGLRYDLRAGEVLGIVGESGSGKSVSALAVLALLPDTASVAGRVLFRGNDILTMPEAERRRLRGNRVALVTQGALAALNPVFTVGDQLAEAVAAHRPGTTRAAGRARAVELLDVVGIPDAATRARQYPHQLSGGMRQRAVIAMAIANDPDVLIADEPTTALDVTVQAQVLDVLQRVRARTDSSIILITHDLGVVAGLADRVLVMYAGRPVETGRVEDIFERPRHPYTLGLLASLPGLTAGSEQRRLYRVPGQPPSLLRVPAGCPFHPRCSMADPARCAADRPALAAVDVAGGHRSACHFSDALAGASPVDLQVREGTGHRTRAPAGEPVLDVTDLVKVFPLRGGVLKRVRATVHAVSGVSFRVHEGETLALVGESGCGKTTIARTVLRLLDPTSGSVRFLGDELVDASPGRLRAARRRMQTVFQDPYSSLNPRMTVGSILAEPLKVHGRWGSGGSDRVAEVMRLVGLSPEDADRYPHQFSGGQCQRVGIARALVLDPMLLILDEPVSALDVSIQAGIVNLLADLQDRIGLAYLFISHDLSVVHHVADRVAIMYLGRIVETGSRAEVYGRPSHPYTVALLSAVPVPEPAVERRRTRIVLEGDVPSPVAPPSGCRFRTRCWKAAEVCAVEDPALVDRGQGHPVACHFPEEAAVLHAGPPAPTNSGS